MPNQSKSEELRLNHPRYKRKNGHQPHTVLQCPVWSRRYVGPVDVGRYDEGAIPTARRIADSVLWIGNPILALLWQTLELGLLGFISDHRTARTAI